jgi:hypothetical protein
MTTQVNQGTACEIGRWEEEAEAALKRAGFTVIDRAGTNNWQGWGVLLGRKEEEFAVLAWSYGSCSGCDSYEGLDEAELIAEFDALVERGLTEQAARKRFSENKLW